MTDTKDDDKKEDKRVFWAVGALLTLFLFVSLAHRIFVVIPAGHSGVLWRLRSGTVLNQHYPEGMHILFPWNEMALYNTRLKSETRSFKAQADGGLTLDVTITFRYRPHPQKLALLHKEIGRDFLESYVVPELASLVSRQIAKEGHSDVYSDRGRLAKALSETLKADDVLSTPMSDGSRQKLVEIPELFVNEVALPADVNDVVKSKFAKLERLEAAEYDRKLVDLENELLMREGKGIAAFQKLLGSGIDAYLSWKSIEATRDAAKSKNSKIVIVGPGQQAPVVVDSGGK